MDGEKLAPEGDPLVGRKIGNYVISELLGEGGMGSVYLARHTDLELKAAVKVLSPQLLVDRAAADRFFAEAQATTRIDHPNVIRIHDFGRFEEGGLYYVMEALEGQSLEEELEQRGTFSTQEALALLEQVCPALQAAHDRGIVHRDLKPSNLHVLSTAPRRIKILDFGIAKLLESHNPGGSGSGPRTAPGLVMGTPDFMAPEHAAGRPDEICPQTDLYSLGVIIYRLLAGRLPIVSESATAMMYKQVTAMPVSIREVDPTVPVAVARVIHRCLEKEPGARFGSATELLEAFRTAVHGEQPSGDTGPRQPTREAPAVAAQSETPSGKRRREKPITGDSTRPLAGLADTGPSQVEAAPPQDTGAGPATRMLVPRQGWGRKAALAAGLLLLAGAAVILAARAADPSGAQGTQSVRDAGPAPPPRHTITIRGAKGASCQLWVDGAPRALPRCDRFEVAYGQKVRLLLSAAGMEPLSERWTVEGDRTIRLIPVPKPVRPDAGARPDTTRPARASTPPPHRRAPRGVRPPARPVAKAKAPRPDAGAPKAGQDRQGDDTIFNDL